MMGMGFGGIKPRETSNKWVMVNAKRICWTEASWPEEGGEGGDVELAEDNGILKMAGTNEVVVAHVSTEFMA
jgi:hypothetical protein